MDKVKKIQLDGVEMIEITKTVVETKASAQIEYEIDLLDIQIAALTAKKQELEDLIK